MLIQKKVLHFAKRHKLFKKGSHIYIAVSGGPDSLALLHFFSSIRKEYELTLTAISVDHQLRKNESLQDLAYVSEICKRWNIEFAGTSLDVPSYKKKTKMGTQSAARELRYRFFEQVMKQDSEQSPLLAMGHHGDDQVETMFMRLIRGTKPGGMPVKRKFANGWIIRPFLCLTKQEILTYCEQQGIDPRVDSSNLSPVYTRNAFRLYMLPFIKEYNPSIHENVQLISESIQEDEQFLVQQAEKAVEQAVSFAGVNTGAKVNLTLFRSFPRPLQRRAFHLILNYLYRKPSDELTSVHLENIFEVMESKDPNKTLHFPKQLMVRKTYDELLFTFEKRKETSFITVMHPGEPIVLPNGWTVYAERIEQNQPPPEHSEWEFVCDAEAVPMPLVVRSRKEGDRIRVRGLNGRKKIKDIFIDEKIPRMLRDSWPVITDQKGNILWLAGLKKGEVDHKTASKWLKIIVEKPDTNRRSCNMYSDIKEVLITEEELQKKIKEIAAQLTEEYRGKFPLAIGVLKGAMPFMADLLKRMETHLEMDFMDVSSYGSDTKSSGEVKIIKDLDTKVEGRDLLIIEDIIDSGLTLSYLVDLFKYRGAKSIKIVTLLDKPAGRKVDIEADIVGFNVPDEFVVGYGLDYNEKYRNLPYIGVLKPEVYSEK